MTDRRSFLRGLVSLPLIGGGVTLIGQPSAPVPLVQAAALPTLDDPRQRARYAWEAFAAAMRDLTTDADGWTILGAAERYRDIPQQRAGSFLRTASIHYAYGAEPRCPSLVFDTHREIEL